MLAHLTCLTVCVCVVRADEFGRIRQSGDQEQHQRLQICGEFLRREGKRKERWTCVQDNEKNAKKQVQVSKRGCRTERNRIGKERREKKSKKGERWKWYREEGSKDGKLENGNKNVPKEVRKKVDVVEDVRM